MFCYNQDAPGVLWGPPPQFRKEWVGFLDLVALWRTLEEE